MSAFFRKLVKLFLYGVITLIPVIFIIWGLNFILGNEISFNLKDFFVFVFETIGFKVNSYYLAVVVFLFLVLLGFLSSWITKGTVKLFSKALKQSLESKSGKVVIFPYFRKGLWTMGVVTKYIDVGKERILIVFVPGVPIPFTGSAPIFVSERDVIYVDNISPSQLLNFFATGGVLSDDELLSALAELVKKNEPYLLPPEKGEDIDGS